ncbi:nucleotidyltransferase family protein [Thermophilibacter sp.]
MAVYTRDELVTMIAPILRRYHAAGASLFGSYARGQATADSDVDLIVHGGPDFRRTDVFSIAEDLFNVSGKRVDVYDDSEVQGDSEFARSARRESVVIV